LKPTNLTKMAMTQKIPFKDKQQEINSVVKKVKTGKQKNMLKEIESLSLKSHNSAVSNDLSSDIAL